MSPTLRAQKLEAAIALLECVVSNLDEAQECGVPGTLPDVDGCLDLAIRAADDATLATKWALELLKTGAAVKAMP